MSKTPWYGDKIFEDEWAYFRQVDGDVWEVREILDREVRGKYCRFRLSELEGDLKNWVLIGATLEDGSEVIELPNATEYNSSNPSRKVVGPKHIYTAHKRKDTIAIYLPTRLLKQIKPLEEEPT